jgi:hypothetical protein
VAVGDHYDCDPDSDALFGDASSAGRGHATPWGTSLGTQSTKRRRRSRLFERTRQYTPLNGWQLLIAVVLGAALGTLLRFAGYGEEAPRGKTMVVTGSDRQEQQDNVALQGPVVPTRYDVREHQLIERDLISKLGAIPACCHTGWQARPASHIESEAGDSGEDFKAISAEIACCTHCHNASSARFVLRSTTAKVSRSCQVCHRDVSIPREMLPEYPDTPNELSLGRGTRE